MILAETHDVGFFLIFFNFEVLIPNLNYFSYFIGLFKFSLVLLVFIFSLLVLGYLFFIFLLF